MTDLTGLRFGQGNGPWGPLMHVTNFQHPITRGLPQDWFWGSTNPIGPLFHLEDPDATTLGQVVYSLGRCKPGFGVKTFNADDPAAAWTSVYVRHARHPRAGAARHRPLRRRATSTTKTAMCSTPRPTCSASTPCPAARAASRCPGRSRSSTTSSTSRWSRATPRRSR